MAEINERQEAKIAGLMERLERTIEALTELKAMPATMFDIGCTAIIVDIKDTLHHVRKDVPYEHEEDEA